MKRLICIYLITAMHLRSQDEEKLTRLEETRQAAMEVAQEEDASQKEAAEDAQEVTMIQWGYGVTRHPRGLQLIGDDRKRVC
jgi:hypothetical protein